MADIVELAGRAFGSKPQPRVLGVNTSDDDRAAIELIAAHSVFVDFFGEVRLAEFDVVVVRQRPSATNRGMQSIAWPDAGLDTVLPSNSPVPFAIVLCGEVRQRLNLLLEELGPKTFSPPAAPEELEGDRFLTPGVPGSRWNDGEVVATAGSICTEFVLPTLDPALERLVKETLLPGCLSRGIEPHNPVLRTSGAARLQPFLTTADGEVLAGRYGCEGRETWILPADLVRLEPWLKRALRDWRVQQPDRFRELSGWGSDERWLTKAERSVQDSLQVLQTERDRAVAEFDRRKSELEVQAAEARSAAEEGARTLLTGESGTLVVAVKSALEKLGFDAEDVDASRKGSSHELLEDLRVTDPEAEGWIALVEVRSYKGGAQLNDLMRLARFEKRYAADTGTFPDRVWYVVNQFRDRDPSSSDRTPVLPSHPHEVEEFGTNGGLVFDTSELFELAEHTGELDRPAIRSMLRRACGRLPSERVRGPLH